MQAGCTLEVAEGSTSTGMRGLVSGVCVFCFFFKMCLINITNVRLLLEFTFSLG